MRDSASTPMAGDFVEVRTRRWLVDSIAGGESLVRAQLAFELGLEWLGIVKHQRPTTVG
jgi:hypothetical protein